MRYHTTSPRCACGSGKTRSACLDGYGTLLFYYCDDCYDKKRARYRPDIFEKYKGEPLDPEE
jgi:hypothetical protein